MNINLHIDIKKSKPQPPGKLYRVLHDPEIWTVKYSNPSHGQFYEEGRGWDWRVKPKTGYPEVFWCFGSHLVELTDEWQYLMFELNKGISGEKHRELYDDWRALANGTGLDHRLPTDPDYIPKRDVVNQRDLNAKLPALDKVRVFGGATLSGTPEGEYLVLDSLDWYNPPSSVQYIIDRPWL